MKELEEKRMGRYRFSIFILVAECAPVLFCATPGEISKRSRSLVLVVINHPTDQPTDQLTNRPNI